MQAVCGNCRGVTGRQEGSAPIRGRCLRSRLARARPGPSRANRQIPWPRAAGETTAEARPGRHRVARARNAGARNHLVTHHEVLAPAAGPQPQVVPAVVEDGRASWWGGAGGCRERRRARGSCCGEARAAAAADSARARQAASRPAAVFVRRVAAAGVRDRGVRVSAPRGDAAALGAIHDPGGDRAGLGALWPLAVAPNGVARRPGIFATRSPDPNPTGASQHPAAATTNQPRHHVTPSPHIDHSAVAS